MALGSSNLAHHAEMKGGDGSMIVGMPCARYLGDFAKEKARGAAVSFVARPFPDRQAGCRAPWMILPKAARFSSGWYTTRLQTTMTCVLVAEASMFFAFFPRFLM